MRGERRGNGDQDTCVIGSGVDGCLGLLSAWRFGAFECMRYDQGNFFTSFGLDHGRWVGGVHHTFMYTMENTLNTRNVLFISYPASIMSFFDSMFSKTRKRRRYIEDMLHASHIRICKGHGARPIPAAARSHPRHHRPPSQCRPSPHPTATEAEPSGPSARTPGCQRAR